MKPNILLIILDSVRARNTSLHGYEEETTPFLETLTADAEWYRQARAPGIHSVASHASIFTGHHVEEHGIIHHESQLDPEETIWSTLSERGYDTGIFTPNTVLTASSNLTAPFETVYGPKRDPKHRYFKTGISPTDVEGHQTNREYLLRCLKSDAPLRSIANGFYFITGNREEYDPAEEGAPEYVDAFFDWSDGRDRWAACLNLMDAHYPYRADDAFESTGDNDLLALHDSLTSPISKEIATTDSWWKLGAIERLYDDCIRQTDAAVANLVEGLQERGELDNTLLIVTSDHGDGFGEWSRVDPDVRAAYHSWGIHEVVTHVPLLVHHPGAGPTGPNNDLASLTEFPSVVKTTLNEGVGSFAVEEYAFTSTYRLESPELMLPEECLHRERFAGPWRAVYKQDGDTVLKFATHGDRSTTLRIRDAQTSYRLSETDEDPSALVQQMYDKMEETDVATDRDKKLSDTVEDQLESLGYIR
ncbi:sulfatase-like hydrolase/transferase [Salinibaculum salinum]|uniref:sulfatase-like hydrolase/transferase n=1 Tax=Salinibaculum salinum TaxID=3131996 RepID=UPI0030EDD748